MKLQHSTIVLHQHALKRLGKLALMVISAGTVVRRLCLGKLALMVVSDCTVVVRRLCLGKLASMVVSDGTVVRRLCLGKLALMVVTVITIIVLSLANIASLHQKESHFTGGLFVLKN